LIDVHESPLASQCLILFIVYAVLRVKGSFQEAAPNNISINSHKKHGRWNEKMAETGQEEGKQNIRIEGALFLTRVYGMFCGEVLKFNH
ncbi:hypothetical protein NQ317_013694, partial [Molorchus minor]